MKFVIYIIHKEVGSVGIWFGARNLRWVWSILKARSSLSV